MGAVTTLQLRLKSGANFGCNGDTPWGEELLQCPAV